MNVMSIREAAEYLGVEYKTVWRAVRKGELPAARIGGVYRIRREDIDALFRAEGASKPAVSSSPPASVCACCGADVPGLLDVGGHCESCGEAICAECWLVKGRHHCPQHPFPGSERADAPSVGLARCARCMRVLPANGPAGNCQADDCDAPLCVTCWDATADRFCHEHAPSPDDRLAQALRDLQSGIIPCLVTALDARRVETTALQRFDQKVVGITTISHPLDGAVYRGPAWQDAHSSGDQVDRLLDLLGAGFLEKERAERLPMNRWSRYELPTVRRKGATQLRIELRMMAHLDAHVEVGFDTRPLAMGELLPVLEQAADMAEGGRTAHILGLASPTGWTEDARRYVAGNEPGQSYLHGYLLPCLVDLLSGQVIYHRDDARIQPFASIFEPELPVEAEQRVIHFIRQYLLIHHGLPVADVAPECRTDSSTVAKAIASLTETGAYRVEQIKDVGQVITAVAITER